ncbi:MAG: LysR substrate-binding domain-containing protein [Pseudomonadota bacterium]
MSDLSRMILPPLPALPSLRALRTFEAACKYKSFLRAAEELNMTPSAVSRQIATMEQQLGVMLFRRTARGVEPTPDGEAYARDVRAALGLLGMATRRFVNASQRQPLRISVQPAICHYWLFPLLADFRRRFPDLHLDLVGSDHPRDDFQRDADFAIDYGKESEARDAGHLVLFRRTSTPVCSPDLLERFGPLEAIGDLQRLPLLHNISAGEEWQEWYGAKGASEVPMAQYQFRERSLTLAAAQHGLGVALGCRNMLREELEAGTLVAPLPETVTYDDVYFLIMSSALEDIGITGELIRWFQGLSETGAGAAVT